MTQGAAPIQTEIIELLLQEVNTRACISENLARFSKRKEKFKWNLGAPVVEESFQRNTI